VGAVVLNIETLINLGAALEGNPVISKTLTITGAVARPATVRVPVGISAAEIIDFAAPKVTDYVVIDGGPVMGSVVSPDAPITKKTGGLIVLPKDHPLALRNTRPLDAILRQARSACEQCQLCSEACPRRLLGHPLYPHLVMRAAGYAAPDTRALMQTLICCGCRMCDYVCPVGLSPSRVSWTFRAKLLAGGIRYTKGSSSAAHPMRPYRQAPSSRIRGWLGVEAFYGHTPWVDHDWRPQRVVVPLAQATGAPATPVAGAGQKVSAGDLIGDIPEGKLGARIHASLSGVVRDVTQSAVVIEREG
jgi:Na+-translocating ferredoxin:NAD+ oxidoreductase RnfC subunit